MRERVYLKSIPHSVFHSFVYTRAVALYAFRFLFFLSKKALKLFIFFSLYYFNVSFAKLKILIKLLEAVTNEVIKFFNFVWTLTSIIL